MQIQLTKVKHSAFASKETNCFEAIVTINGKPAFQVSNEGRGGSDFHQSLKGQSQVDFRANLKAVEAYAESLPEILLKGLAIKQNSEILIANLLNDWLGKRQFDKLIQKGVLMVEGAEVFTAKFKGVKKASEITDAQWKLIEEKYPNAKILNRMPQDQALRVYLAAGEASDAKPTDEEMSPVR